MLAIDPGLFGFMVMVPSILIGWAIGAAFEIPLAGALLGAIGLPGWLITFAYGITKKKRHSIND